MTVKVRSLKGVECSKVKMDKIHNTTSYMTDIFLLSSMVFVDEMIEASGVVTVVLLNMSYKFGTKEQCCAVL